MLVAGNILHFCSVIVVLKTRHGCFNHFIAPQMLALVLKMYIWFKEDLHRKLGILILPITNSSLWVALPASLGIRVQLLEIENCVYNVIFILILFFQLWTVIKFIIHISNGIFNCGLWSKTQKEKKCNRSDSLCFSIVFWLQVTPAEQLTSRQ